MEEKKRIPLLGMNLEQLTRVALEAGLPKFAGANMARWLYVRKAGSISEMTDISKAGREKLEKDYEVGLTHRSAVSISSDGTKKYLYRVGEKGFCIETVMIPDSDRATLCVSSQAGCKMGCKFCMTGRQGFHGNLSASEILSQIIDVDESDALTNIVFMGMGEPLDNFDEVMKAIDVLTSAWGFAWSPKRITLSTIGVLPNLRRYLDTCKCHLAVSLHNPFPEERLQLMPAQKAWGEEEILKLIKEYDFSGQRRVSFEYTMFAGFNDSKRHARALAMMLKGLECRVNLIRFHKIPDFPYDCPSAEIMESFKQRLESYGITTTIRASRGEDILAACGMLAGKHNDL